MSDTFDGGPAFPVSSAENEYVEFGMSLRDYFAGQALPHCIRASEHDGAYDAVSAAVAAYHYADVMLEVRGPKE